MTVVSTPKVEFSLLDRADGSAHYSYNGYSVVGAVNGPVEVQRRDELPEEAAIDVTIRPAVGVRGVRERHFESVLHRTLRHVILVSAHPRTLIQITLQVTGTPPDDTIPGKPSQASTSLAILPALLQTSILTLLSTSIPMSMTLTSTLIIIGPNRDLIVDPSPQDLRGAISAHALAFSSQGRLLVAESEGSFDIDTWEAAYNVGLRTCRGGGAKSREGDDVDMDSGEKASLEDFMRGAVEEKLTRDLRWKESRQ